jgi:hypothetical protein
MSPKEKIEWMEWILQHETVKETIGSISSKTEKNPFRKLLIRALKRNQINQAIQIMSIRNKAAIRFNEFFQKARTFVRS